MPDNIWNTTNNDVITISSRRSSIFETRIISGNDMSMTTNAYTDIIIPARASVVEKSAAMSLNSPIGMNSEVLNINAAQVNPIRGNQFFNVILFSIFQPCIFA